MIDGRDDQSLDVVRTFCGRPDHAGADHRRIITGDIGDEQRARGPPAQMHRQTAALDERALGAPRIQLADGNSSREPFGRQPLQVRVRSPRLEHFHEARRAPGHEEQRIDVWRELVHPTQQSRASRQRALIRHRMRALKDLDALNGLQLRQHMPVLGDDEGALDSRPERVVCTEHHRGGSLANGRHPNRAIHR